MTAVSAEEGSLSSKRSWNLKAELRFIYLNAGSAESAFGRTRLKVRYWAQTLIGGPTHDGSGGHAPGPPRPGLPRKGLFALGVIFAELGAMNGGGICFQAVFFILFQVTTMIDEKVARLRAHNSNIIRYRRLLETDLSDLERGFIEKRLNEERSAVKSLANHRSSGGWD